MALDQLHATLQALMTAIDNREGESIAEHLRQLDELGNEAPPMLRHYLEKRSYAKAWIFWKGAMRPQLPTAESSMRRAFYETIACVPYGKVATYGQIATLAGYPGRARQVGFALAGCPGNGTCLGTASSTPRQGLAAQRQQISSVAIRAFGQRGRCLYSATHRPEPVWLAT